jgi:predicted nucleotidyltransferase
LASRFGMTDVRVFGLQAHGTASEDSHGDLVVPMHFGSRLLNLIGFEAGLSVVR